MLKVKISGLTCGNCARRVTRAVEALPGVERALVDLKDGEMVVDGTADAEAVRAAVEKAGYGIAETDESPSAAASSPASQ